MVTIAYGLEHKPLCDFACVILSKQFTPKKKPSYNCLLAALLSLE